MTTLDPEFIAAGGRLLAETPLNPWRLGDLLLAYCPSTRVGNYRITEWGKLVGYTTKDDLKNLRKLRDTSKSWPVADRNEAGVSWRVHNILRSQPDRVKLLAEQLDWTENDAILLVGTRRYDKKKRYTDDTDLFFELVTERRHMFASEAKEILGYIHRDPSEWSALKLKISKRSKERGTCIDYNSSIQEWVLVETEEDYIYCGLKYLNSFVADQRSANIRLTSVRHLNSIITDALDQALKTISEIAAETTDSFGDAED
jgi:hypothetical protein